MLDRYWKEYHLVFCLHRGKKYGINFSPKEFRIVEKSKQMLSVLSKIWLAPLPSEEITSVSPFLLLRFLWSWSMANAWFSPAFLYTNLIYNIEIHHPQTPSRACFLSDRRGFPVYKYALMGLLCFIFITLVWIIVFVILVIYFSPFFHRVDCLLLITWKWQVISQQHLHTALLPQAYEH